MNRSTSNTRLLKLADFLDTLKTKQFNFDSCIDGRDNHGCGTVCCAIGWTPAVFPELVDWDDPCLTSWNFDQIAYRLFDIGDDAITYLFVPGFLTCDTTNRFGKRLSRNTTPGVVARRIRKFVAKHNQ